MKKTLLIMMALLVLIAAVGCRANNKKDNKPMTTPSAEVIPDSNGKDEMLDEGNKGEIPENGVNSGSNGNNNAVGGENAADKDMQNGNTADNTQNNGTNNGTNNGETAAPELVPSAEAVPPDATANAEK